MSVQRFRVLYSRDEGVRYISHLDTLRFWERAIRRAGLPLSYSQGFTPHPKIAFASPLPLGFLGEAEIMDVTLDEWVDAAAFRERLAAQSNASLAVVEVREVALGAQAPQAVLAWASYAVLLPGVEPAEAQGVVAAFLALATFPWTEERQEKQRAYDLRAGVASLAACATDGGSRLSMRLSARAGFTVRPEQVAAALFPGATPGIITRTGQHLDEPSPAHSLWRRKGRFER